MHLTPSLESNAHGGKGTGILWFSGLVACLLLMSYKFFLVDKLNINWDEFYYLNFVHSAMRGELTLLLHGAFTHLFAWLPSLSVDEIGQVNAARTVMVVLLGVTAWLVWRLAKIWTTGFSALLAPFVYLSCMPVLMHGGSFRSDSMLAPLTIAATVLIASGRGRPWRDVGAGALLGAAFAVSVKVALFAPLVLGLLVFRARDSTRAAGKHLPRIAVSSARLVLSAAATATLFVFMHWLTIPVAAESIAQFGARAAAKTLIDVPWFPRLAYLREYVHWQPLHWLLMLVGAIAAVARRRLDLASLALALLPVVFYRNAFPYFYVVMVAPLSVLAAYAVQELGNVISQKARRPAAGRLVVVVIWLGLLYQGLFYAGNLRHDGQSNQRMLMAAVHQVFEEPVNYVDRCGMVSSFRKVNFFMSTWGMESYRERSEPFMPAAIRDHRPAFVLVNSPYLDPSQRFKGGLLPEDYELIARYFPKYWGPLRVAGATARINSSEERLLTVPFAAEYRIRTDTPVLVEGLPRADGEVVFVPEAGIRVVAAADRAEPVLVQLFLATARPPPQEQLPNVPLFSGL